MPNTSTRRGTRVEDVTSVTTRPPQYSFCEEALGGLWHIRQLTEIGRKLGGEADTAALCGRRVSWDLSVEIETHYFKHSCPQCVLMFAADNNETELESSEVPQERVVVRHSLPSNKKSVTWITKVRDWVLTSHPKISQ